MGLFTSGSHICSGKPSMWLFGSFPFFSPAAQKLYPRRRFPVAFPRKLASVFVEIPQLTLRVCSQFHGQQPELLHIELAVFSMACVMQTEKEIPPRVG